MSSFFVYILECADTSFYIGSTNDLEKRLREHNGAKAGAHYTKIRRPVILRYSEKLSSLNAARAREAALKRLTRAQKSAIISGLSLARLSMGKGNNSQRKEKKKPKKEKKK